jgi:hypothetical protein
LKFFSLPPKRNINNFNHLTRFDLSLREANSTAFQTAVNHLFHRFVALLQERDRNPNCATFNIQLVDYQGVFRLVYAGSGANYREI